MYDFTNVVKEKYNLEIRDVKPHRGAIIIFTDKGNKLLKHSFFSKERIEYVDKAKNHLVENGFITLDPFILNNENLPYSEYDEGVFAISELIDGRECDFMSDSDSVKAAIALAKMHKASKGFIHDSNSCKSNMGKIPYFYNKRLEEIRKLKKKAEREKKMFDYMFLENFKYFYDLGKNSLDMIYLSNYSKLVEQTNQLGIICHNDYNYQNIKINKNGDVYIINFDFCNLELKVYDVVNLLRRKMRKSNWDISRAKEILNAYRSIENLNKEELFVMKIMLKFPQKFWRVVNKYYNSRRSWAQKNYITRLEEVVEEKDDHQNFIERFDSII